MTMIEAIQEDLEEMGFDCSEMTEDSKIVEDLGMDSLDFVELATKLEARYSITINDDQMEQVKTIGDIVKVLKSFF